MKPCSLPVLLIVFFLSSISCINLFGGTPILGETALDARQMWEFVRQNNPDFPMELADHYVEVGKIYGIRGDMALCQAIIETGWFKFSDGTAVRPSQHNYCGLGVVKRGSKGLSFKSARDGVTAQMQHLYAYASKNPLPSGEQKLDKRFGLVSRGSSPTWEELSGRWASNPRYGDQILALYNQMMASVDRSVPTVTTEEDKIPLQVRRKYKNGNDRRNKNKDIEALKDRNDEETENDGVKIGTVGPVTARYLGINLSDYRSSGEDGNTGSETSLPQTVASDDPETGIDDKKKKKDKKSKRQKNKKEGRKIPKNAIRATIVNGSSLETATNQSHEESEVETLASVPENTVGNDGLEPQRFGNKVESTDTISVSKTTSRTVKIIRRR